MRILVVGAGGIGGYFGGRLLEAGQDVTFLVRPKRAEILAQNGLIIHSKRGEANLAHPPTVLAENVEPGYDLVILSCKAYDLDGAIESMAGGVGPDTAILPLLNGLDHLARLQSRFGAQAVLGGIALISTTLDGDGAIRHMGELAALTVGELDGKPSDRIEAITAALKTGNFDTRASDAILQEMWEKFVFITSAAGSTGMMRGTIGDIMAAGGQPFIESLMRECEAIAAAHGHGPSENFSAHMRKMLLVAGSPLSASLARDIENSGKIEADHIVGSMIRHAREKGVACPVLDIVFTHLKTYEARQARLAAK